MLLKRILDLCFYTPNYNFILDDHKKLIILPITAGKWLEMLYFVLFCANNSTTLLKANKEVSRDFNYFFFYRNYNLLTTVNLMKCQKKNVFTKMYQATSNFVFGVQSEYIT